MIHSPTQEIHQTKRALLVWQAPLDGEGARSRYPVGEITQSEGNSVRFRYLSDECLREPKDKGFNGYPGLPMDHDKAEVLSSIASSILIRRLPPREREDFPEIIQRYGLMLPHEEYTDLTLLARTGACLLSDSFSICETFDGFSLPFTYIFDVAGYRHYARNHLDLQKDDQVTFLQDKDNKHDPKAIKLEHEGKVLGYINRLQAPVIGDWMDKGVCVSARIFRKNGIPTRPRLFVHADIQANPLKVAV